MSDDLTQIQIKCSSDLKNEVKRVIMEKGFNLFQEGYEKIFELGFIQFKKIKKGDAKK